RRRVGPRIALVRMVDVGVRIDMEDGQPGMPAADGTHDGMRDGMISTEADQRIARLQRAPHITLDSLPRIDRAIENDVTMIDQRTWSAEVNARLAPTTVDVGK